MGIKDKITSAISSVMEDLSVDLEGEIYGTSTGTNASDTTWMTSTVAPATSTQIWVDDNTGGSASSDLVFTDGLGQDWTVGSGQATLQLGNAEIVITEEGEVKISVTEGDDITEFYFSTNKVKSFLEQFSDAIVTRKIA